MINYRSLVKPDTFIGQYMKMMEDQETPYAYDFWCALWVMSVIVGRRVKVDRPHAPVFLNWYVFLVAESGVTRKSTAIAQATKIAQEMLHALVLDTLLLQGKTTPESFEHIMHEQSAEKGHAHIALSVSELIRFMGKERYNMALPGLLTDLYDCPEYRSEGGTIAHGNRVYRNVYLAFLTASTPSWLHRGINPDVVTGGFTSRCLVIHAEKRKKAVAWPVGINQEAKDAVEVSLVNIDRMADQHPNIVLQKGAMKYFTEWYRSKPSNVDSFRSTFESREDAHVLRLAACLAINDGSWVIDRRHLQVAVRIIKEVKQAGSDIFGGTSHEDTQLNGITKLRQALIAAGRNGIKHSELSKKVRRYLDTEDIMLILTLMHEMQLVNKLEPEFSGSGRRPIVWQATRLILDESVSDLVLERFDPSRR